MVKADTNFLKMADIMKANGEMIKCKEKDSLTLAKVKFNIQENGNQINIMVGEFYTRILKQIQIGFLIKVSLKMV
jgi:hypothetical protein